MVLSKSELKDFLDEKHDLYNRPEFIENDPISIPHKYTLKEDIEIAGFLSASIAWGNRKMIIRNAEKMMKMMDDAPFDFIINHNDYDLSPFSKFVHRTFNGTDCLYFIHSLANIYKKHNGLESVFSNEIIKGNSVKSAIIHYRNVFFEANYPDRTSKHIANPERGSAAKRINMFLRWMVRKDNKGVDFGIWNDISPAGLLCPLDVHTGNVSRKLSLLGRKQNDWKAVEELSNELRKFDPLDPIKYDFALFGLGINEHF